MTASRPAADPLSAVTIRELEMSDLAVAAQVAADGFGFDISEPALARRWRQRLAHLVKTDPDGGFVAELDGQIVGVAQAMRRERLWCLSLLAVDPCAQSSGAGRALLDGTLAYGSDLPAGLIVSSEDPRALRLYALAGFSLKPTFQAEGLIDRRALPRAHPGVREGGEADLEAIANISRHVRGAPHTPELCFQLSRDSRLLRFGDRGFAVTLADHGVWLLAARDEEAAIALLWTALEGLASIDRPVVRWITGAQDWAVDVVLQAGLRLGTYGALGIRGNPGPLTPFIPSAPFA